VLSIRLPGFIHHIFTSSSSKLLIVFLLAYSTAALAQDSPGRFEVGGGFTALRFSDPTNFRPTSGNFGPALEGDFNFGRHFALDAAYSWLPASSSSGHAMTGFFGAKVGTRTEHFGFFVKVRPGFITMGNVLRSETIFTPTPPMILGGLTVPRFGRLTERALDVGGVMEYYPARHWALRWDMGNTVVFEEKGPTFTIVPPPPFPPEVFTTRNGSTRGHFQFSTGVHYRF
jgi:hypothetical protein